MRDRSRAYPCAVTCNGAEKPAQAEVAAIRWIAAQLKQVGGQVLLYVPQKRNLELNNGFLPQFAKVSGVVVGTWRGQVSGWSGGPVLAAWPNSRKLAEIADDYRTKALCVIPWVSGETAAWQQAANPELLAGTAAEKVGQELDPVVVVALTQLSGMVNQANNLAGALDHRDAVAVLRTLHKGGYRLPADAVYAWALGTGWPVRGADRLRELAEKIDAGRAVQMKGRSPLRSDILAQWREEAERNET